MAWSASKIFSALITDALNNTAALDLNADTFKAALFNNSITPDQTVATASTVFDAGVWDNVNEVADGAEWPAGGATLASVTSAFTTNVYKFDAADTASGSSATLANVFGCQVYDDTVGDQGVCYNYFGGTQSVTDGTLTIIWNAAGVFSLTL